MAKMFLTDINLNGNKLQNTVIESVASAADIAQAQCWTGRMVFDESDSKFKYYNGTQWIAGAKYEATNAAADVASKRYGMYYQTAEGSGNNTGKTTLTFRALAITDAQALTLAESGGIVTLGLQLDGTSLAQTASGLKANLLLKKLATPQGDDAATYQLQDASGNVYGDTINIDKDRFLKEAVIGTMGDTIDATTGVITTGTGDTALDLVFHLADGTYSLAKINMQDFIEESEFADGLDVTNHVVKVKIDSTSESFLTVGANGVKLSGVQDAIDGAAAAAKTSITEVAADATIPSTGAPKIIITKDSTAADGHDNYAISGQDLASKTVQDTINGGDTVNGSFRKAIKDAKATIDAYKVNGKDISTSPTLEGKDIDLSNTYATAATAAAPAAGDDIETAIGKLQKEVESSGAASVKSYKQVIAAASSSPVTIAKATHGCGDFVQVQAFLGGQLVEVDVTNNLGAITIAWNGTLTSDLTVIITGNPTLA